jgi:hypothetical protein
MSNRNPRRTLLFILLLVPFILFGCGDGWDAYRDDYNTDPGPPPGQPWEGDETVWVVLGQTEIETALEGIVTSEFRGAGGVPLAGVRLSDLIETSQITDNPELFRYDFTATDGYNLLGKRGNDLDELPDWENMQHGFLYRTPSDDLEVAWDPAEQPWGTAVSAYNVQKMNGGTIELLEP